ncbi:transglutaminase-like domain-containing protein [Jannaschia aquimarina]|uniref:Transglutaminase-like superfamily protein n=1 Tax=Jannaschia aquimarina TaxID=935700 RepID=A0A0D1EHS6_9RHOB|nr:transglutaminase family protein [Jannaschia aquimarina]KIT16441.1 Transglutaminase-like superfamily protein [Jannaschia aquimarina]SNS92423.1 Transglutaminase-like enzyme, putative cysteine protease [Jannaschia aquimarina]
MTRLAIDSRMTYEMAAPCDCLLQIEVAHAEGQDILSESLSTTPVDGFVRIAAEGGVGTRAWMGAAGQLGITHLAEVEVTRPDRDLRGLPPTDPRALPAEVTSYLMPSRYAVSDLFEGLMDDKFADLVGGALAVAIRDWIEANFAYIPGASGPTTTAYETFMSRRGVCRDYAHVFIALARAASLPARMASVYAPDVDPPDFHAVAQVWLDGAWHFIDPTGMAKPSNMALIGVGRDAADVSFLTVIGAAALIEQSVSVRRLGPA